LPMSLPYHKADLVIAWGVRTNPPNPPSYGPETLLYHFQLSVIVANMSIIVGYGQG